MTVYGARTQAAIHRLASLTRDYDGVAEGSRVASNTPARHKVSKGGVDGSLYSHPYTLVSSYLPYIPDLIWSPARNLFP